MTERVISLALWTVGLLWLVPMMMLQMALMMVWRADRLEWLSRLYCRGQVMATGARWRAEVHPEVDPDKPYLFVCNHVSLLDHVTMYNATPHFKQGIELESHFRIPVYGWFMRLRGTIPVRRGGGRSQLARLQADVAFEVGQGHSILGFPEGTRTRDGRVGRFRKGLFAIARELKLDVVPVAVVGTYEVLAAESGMIRSGGDITVYCDAPVSMSSVPEDQLEGLVERIRGIVAARVDDHRRERGLIA